MVLHQAPPEFETPIDLVPLDPERQRDIHRERDHVSREVPPLADAAGEAETRDEGVVWQPGADTVAYTSMDIDVIKSPETDLKELFSVMTRDAVAQVKEHDQQIMSVIKALGENAGRYKRERKAAIRAVVSEIDSPPRAIAAAKLFPLLKIIPGFALDLTVADSDGRLWDIDDVVMSARDRLLS